MTTLTFDREIEALERGLGVLDLGRWSLTEVRGAEAASWLNDLITTSTEGLAEGEARRSLLLSPTGRVRADFHVLRDRGGEAFLLLQGPGQPDRLDALLAPYVLSSAVEIDAADPDGLLVTPRDGDAWTAVWASAEDPGRVLVGAEALEAWRIRRGVARFPYDLDTDSLPAEGGLDVEPVIDRAKGCYLGQESVARVRNLGHPPRLVFAVRASSPPRPAVPVVSDGAEVGTVTSVEPGGGSAAMVRIRWDARDTELATEDGIALERR